MPPGAPLKACDREIAQMMRVILFAVFTIVGQQVAVAAPVTATGPIALALAAVVAQHSPLGRAFDKRIIARLFGGRTNFGFTPNTKISVTADSVVCRTSNFDITARTCDLTFGVRKRTLTGREANEVSATGLTAGASSEGAAGSRAASVRNHGRLAPESAKCALGQEQTGNYRAIRGLQRI